MTETLPLKWLDTALWPGTLVFAAPPENPAGLRALAAQGVRVLACPLPLNEMPGGASLPVQADQHNLEVLRFSLPRGGTPADTAGFGDFLDALTVQLLEGHTVALLDTPGEGRAALTAAALLGRVGLSPEQALARVPAVNAAQRQYLEARE